MAVTTQQVKAIIDTDKTDLTAFIAPATLIVNEELKPKKLSSSRLDLIEICLAAHFLTINERQLKGEKFGDASAEYLGDGGMYLKSSLFGQTAIELDTTGVLANKGNAKAIIELIS